MEPNKYIEIHTKQIPNLMRKLQGFLGVRDYQKALRKYKRGVSTLSGAYLRDYYENLHPWWPVHNIL